MDAAALLSEYVRRHNDGVGTGGFAPLAALFADDGEIRFHGLPAPPLCGPGTIERGFRDCGPDAALVAGEVIGDSPSRAQAVYGWSGAPHLVEGVLRLESRDGRIARLGIHVRRGGPAAPRDREAARLVVLAPGPRVLLLLCREPSSGAEWWITPGGGLDAGEDWERAARRELVEELGPVEGTFGPCLWTREHTFVWDDNVVRQRERYFRFDVAAAFVPAPSLAPAELAREGLLAHRWWTPGELAAERAQVFSPRRFASLLTALLRDGPPRAPIDAGI